MNRTDALKLSQSALKELEHQLSKGKSDNLTRFIKAMATFNRYSFRNLMMILAQRQDATHVAGVRSWNRLNRFVRKGEKGIAIFAPMVFKTDAAGDEKDSTRINFRVVHVFDIGQTEGEELPDLNTVAGNPARYLDQLKQAVAENGIALEYQESLGSALGKSCGGQIRLKNGLAPAEEFSVLAHEFAHELLHQGTIRTETSEKQRELEAEAVAFVLCKYAGLECSTAHSEYIQLYSGDVEALSSSLESIQRTASRIIDSMSEEPEALAA